MPEYKNSSFSKLKLSTDDLTKENIDYIAAKFPNVITEMQKRDKNGNPQYDIVTGDPIITKGIDFVLLWQELQDSLVGASLVDEYDESTGKTIKRIKPSTDERYRLDWAGKKQSVLTASTPSNKTLRPVKDDETTPSGELINTTNAKQDSIGYKSTGSVDFDNTQNLYIEGDNLEVLKLLRNTYLGKIKMIYIDPPYNTGNDFVYNDDFSDSMANDLSRTGQLADVNSIDNKQITIKKNSKKEIFQNSQESIEMQKVLESEIENTNFDATDKKRLIKMTTNKDTSGRYHSDWLSMMFCRLKLARDLLTDDGVIFISIDDNESHNLRKICDELFGPDNFYGQFIQIKGSTQNDSKTIQRNAEFVLCYSKTRKDLLLTYNNVTEKKVYQDDFYLGRDTGASSGHDRLIDRPNLGYTIYYLSNENGATGNNNRLIDRPNLGSDKYPGFEILKDNNGNFRHAIAIKDYDDKKISDDAQMQDVYNDVQYLIDLGYTPIRPPERKGGKLGCWTWGIEGFKEKWNKNEVFIKDNKNVIQKIFIKNTDEIFEKNGQKYIRVGNSLPLQNILKDFPTSEGTKSTNELFPENNKLFNNPKNMNMLKFFIESLTLSNKDAIILDFFSGSATTGHAVMSLNAQDGGSRKFIMVQVPEATPIDSEAYKAGYNNICEIGKERLRRAGNKLKLEHIQNFEKLQDNYTKENKDPQKQPPEYKPLDTGFRVLKLDSSCFNNLELDVQDYTHTFFANNALLESIKSDRSPLDLLFACMLTKGIVLSSPIHTRKTKHANKTYYIIGDISGTRAEALNNKNNNFDVNNANTVAEQTNNSINSATSNSKFIGVNTNKTENNNVVTLQNFKVDKNTTVNNLEQSNINALQNNCNATVNNLERTNISDSQNNYNASVNNLGQVNIDDFQNNNSDNVDIITDKNYLIEVDLVCYFEKTIDYKDMQELANLQPMSMVFLESAFEKDDQLINVEQIFKRISPNTKLDIL